MRMLSCVPRFLVASVLCASALGGATACAQKFISAAVRTVSGDPTVLATADFNHDGRADIVYQDARTGGHLHVMFGNGDGTFHEAQQIALPAGVGNVITVADLNGDGFPDLIVNYDGFDSSFASYPQFAALLNRGDGTFGAPIFSTFPADSESDGINRIAVADFDGSGHLGFIFQASAGIILMHGDGSGHFRPEVLFPATVADAFDNVYVGDFNEDGKPDFAVDGFSGMRYALNLGQGHFGALQALPLVLTNPRLGDAVADVNHDGHDDILYGANGSLFVAYGRGDGTFAAPVSRGSASDLIVAVQDSNGDGLPDIVTENLAGPISMLQQTDGTFSAPYEKGPATGDVYFRSPVYADFDGDGIADIVSGATGALIFSKGRSDGSFAGAEAIVAGGGLDVQTADLNRDGHLDLVLVTGGGSPGGALETYLGDGTGQFRPCGFAKCFGTLCRTIEDCRLQRGWHSGRLQRRVRSAGRRHRDFFRAATDCGPACGKYTGRIHCGCGFQRGWDSGRCHDYQDGWV